MGNFIETKLTGDMMAGFDKLLAAAGESTLRAAGFAGAAVIRDEAKQRVPVDTGVLKANIIVKRAEEKSDANTKQTYLVTVRKGKFNAEGDAFYFTFVEFGHSYVSRKTNKKQTWKSHRAAMALEYGTAKKGARPFLRPAYEAKKKEAVDAMRDRFAEKLKEELAKS